MSGKRKSSPQFFVCTIVRGGQLCDLKIYLGDYAEQALQKFMSPRRHAWLTRQGLPTWFGEPTVCRNNCIRSVNEGCEIEASPLKKQLDLFTAITDNDELERKILGKILDMEQGKSELDPAFIRKLGKALFRIAKLIDAATASI